MPTIRANGLDIGYEVRRRRAAAGHAPRRDHRPGARHFAAAAARLSKAFRVYLPDARGHGATRWDAPRVRRTTGWSTTSLAFADALGLGDVPPARLLDGRDDRARLRRPSYAGAARTLVVVGISPEREPRASVARRQMDPARIERDDPALGARPGRPARPGPGARRVAAAAAGDRGGRRRPAAAHGRRAAPDRASRPWSPAATATRSCRSGKPGRSTRALPDGRLLVAPECGHEVMTERPEVFARRARRLLP